MNCVGRGKEISNSNEGMCQGSKNFFLPGSKLSTFVSSCVRSPSFSIYCPNKSHFLSLPDSFPSFPSFLSSIFLSVSFALLPYFLPGKFEHISYLPGGAATTLPCYFIFFNPGMCHIFCDIISGPNRNCRPRHNFFLKPLDITLTHIYFTSS